MGLFSERFDQMTNYSITYIKIYDRVVQSGGGATTPETALVACLWRGYQSRVFKW